VDIAATSPSRRHQAVEAIQAGLGDAQLGRQQRAHDLHGSAAT
jgi:hypothetical protein